MTPEQVAAQRFYLRSIKAYVDCWLLKISLDPKWRRR